ncbi:MAG: hypothetical protein GX817_05045 [Elusimicrobia bacterium]|nr:hypothetical protein [Elusimicrobiota bacterium]
MRIYVDLIIVSLMLLYLPDVRNLKLYSILIFSLSGGLCALFSQISVGIALVKYALNGILFSLLYGGQSQIPLTIIIIFVVLLDELVFVRAPENVFPPFILAALLGGLGEPFPLMSYPLYIPALGILYLLFRRLIKLRFILSVLLITLIIPTAFPGAFFTALLISAYPGLSATGRYREIASGLALGYLIAHYGIIGIFPYLLVKGVVSWF